MNEDKRHSADKKLPPLDLESIDWTHDRLVFERVMKHGSQEDKNALLELSAGLQELIEFADKIIQRNENKRSPQ